jgi:transcriptional regulator with XRE-family HTH domain
MTSQTIKAIAVKLRSARQDRGLTQEDVATKAKLSTNYYARIERAEVSPSVETLEKLVKALKIKSSDVLPF